MSSRRIVLPAGTQERSGQQGQGYGAPYAESVNKLSAVSGIDLDLYVLLRIAFLCLGEPMISDIVRRVGSNNL